MKLAFLLTTLAFIILFFITRLVPQNNFSSYEFPSLDKLEMKRHGDYIFFYYKDSSKLVPYMIDTSIEDINVDCLIPFTMFP